MCEPCEAGTYLVPSSHACVQCPAGTHRASSGGVGVSSCTECAAGGYSRAGASACSECGADTYSSSSGQGSCSDCPFGQHTAGRVGETSCSLHPLTVVIPALIAVVAAAAAAAGVALCMRARRRAAFAKRLEEAATWNPSPTAAQRAVYAVDGEKGQMQSALHEGVRLGQQWGPEDRGGEAIKGVELSRV